MNAPVRGYRASPSHLGRVDMAVAGLLICLVLALGHGYIVPTAAGAYHDDGIYLATAKSLAEGHGYRLINLPGAPLQTKYPIFYPALLAVAWKIAPHFPDNLLFLKSISLGCCALAAGMAYLFLVRFGYTTRRIAAAGCLLAATSPGLLYFGGLTMAEAPFAVLVIIALWAMEATLSQPSPTTSRQRFLLGIVASLPMLCRLNGLALVLPGALVLWKRKEPVRSFLWGAALVISAWFAWVLFGRFSGAGSMEMAYYTDYVGWWTQFGPPAMGRIVTTNLLCLLHSLILLTVPGLLSFTEKNISTLFSVMLVVVVNISLIFYLLTHKIPLRPLPWAIICYLALSIVWPWPIFRFLIPISLFIAVFIVHVISGLFFKNSKSILKTLALAGVVAFTLVQNIQLVMTSGHTIQQKMYPLILADNTVPVWTNYQELFQWAKTHTRDTDILASGLDSMTYLYTGRRAYRPFVSNPLVLYYDEPGLPLKGMDVFLTHLRHMKPRYILSMPMPYFKEGQLFNALLTQLAAAPTHPLRLVWVGRDPRFKIYEPVYDHGPQPPAPPANTVNDGGTKALGPTPPAASASPTPPS